MDIVSRKTEYKLIEKKDPVKGGDRGGKREYNQRGGGGGYKQNQN